MHNARRGKTTKGVKKNKTKPKNMEVFENKPDEFLVNREAISETELEAPSRTHKYAKRDETLGATQLYLNEIGFSPLLTAEEEVYYSRLIAKGDQEARKRM